VQWSTYHDCCKKEYELGIVDNKTQKLPELLLEGAVEVCDLQPWSRVVVVTSASALWWF
jgi:hypothetical protein